MDTVFRSKGEAVFQEVAQVSSDASTSSVETGVDVPYTDFERTNRKPFTVEYFNMGNLWDDPQGGFTEEVKTIEGYLNHKVEKGDIANSLSAIKNELQELEKVNNLKKEERMTIKLGVLSAYARFLMETEGVRGKVRKYGTNE